MKLKFKKDLVSQWNIRFIQKAGLDLTPDETTGRYRLLKFSTLPKWTPQISCFGRKFKKAPKNCFDDKMSLIELADTLAW